MTGSEPAQNIRRIGAEERRLVEAAQRDPARFADLYESFFELVYSYVVRRVPSRAEAEDLTAEVFHRALRSLPRFKWTGAPFAAWLFRIAANMIADRAKRAAREHGAGVVGETAAATGQAQTNIEEVERQARLFRLVEALAEDQRRVILMRFVEEKSIREISQALQRSEGAIKQLQFRALQNLRKELTTEDTEKRTAKS
ncbi:MAG TPA: sigma-70 family RNA polymerase sigma factor [Pyrinomonadaceae bacterium]|nr:sigma-70 family RNA polymerase sigma factor [Pyrinomonadaceae bacterium]